MVPMLLAYYKLPICLATHRQDMLLKFKYLKKSEQSDSASNYSKI